MKVVRKIIEIDEELCNGCGQCIVDCAEAALEIVDGKAKVVADKYCDGLGACMGGCPTGALTLVERECDEFDEEAVEELLKAKKEAESQPELACGCAGSKMQSFPAAGQTPCQAANKPQSAPATGDSQLSHWPVQIRLIPPSAPFLQGADLLIAADCTTVARASFHQDFLAGRVVMMGCPKFDDQQTIIQKFTEIFRTANLKSITAVIMEVPCCGSMKGLIDRAMKESGADIPLHHVTISTRGEILSQ
ncbi:MAG: 4Fe-4S dicluster domain-containing protein [Thermodesulfobacteriota bacterium]